MIIIACTVVVHVDVASGDGRSGIDIHIDLIPSNAIAIAKFSPRRWTGLECHGGNTPLAIVETAIIESQPRTELGG